MHVASLLPLVAFLATANAAAIPRAGSELETANVTGLTVLDKRQNCWFDPFGFIFSCGTRPRTTTTIRPSSTSSSASRTAAAPTTTPAVSSLYSSASRASDTSSSSGASSSASPIAAISSSVVSVASSTATGSSIAAINSEPSSTSTAAVTPVTSVTSLSAGTGDSPAVVLPTTLNPSSVSIESESVHSIIESVSASSVSASDQTTSSAVAVPTTTSTSTTSTTTSSAIPTPTNAIVSGWRYVDDIQGGLNGRALVAASTTGQDMTVETCLAYCDSQNFPLAGLEYGAECYCGTVLANGASLSKTAIASMPCAGDAQQLCGGPSTLSLYVSTKSNADRLSADLTSQAVTLPAGWSAGSSPCVQEVAGRALVEKSTAADDMTVAKCADFCGDFKYAGLEYGRECYCGNTLQNGASLSLTSTQCVMPCAGESTSTCGGPSAIQLYANANFQPVTSSGNFVNAGCVQEVVGRALRGASTAGPDMTIDQCTSFCASRGFKIAGLEYGAECYCDNEWQGGASLSLWSGQCHMPCAGAAGENCGGPNAINVFTVSV